MQGKTGKLFKFHHKPGTAPGTLVTPPDSPFPVMRVMAYDLDHLAEQEIKSPDESLPLLKKWPAVWINVDGLGSAEIIEKFGQMFELHPLALEDVLLPHQRSKTEDYEDYLFIVLRMARIMNGALDLEQISLFLGKKYVLTFQERPDGDCLDPVRDRIRHGKGRRVRFSQTDYLAYAIIDAIVDGYFPVIEHYSEKLSVLEDEVLESPRREQIAAVHDIKRDLRLLRHALWPMREMITGFSANTHLLSDETRPYLRDCHDHIVQVMDLLENCRERTSSLIEVYVSSVSNKMNEIMQTLTIIATIFMPLSFITGLYGMNFSTEASPWNMPELHWRYGYFFALGLMAATAAGLLYYFKRKGWLKPVVPPPGKMGGGKGP